MRSRFAKILERASIRPRPAQSQTLTIGFFGDCAECVASGRGRDKGPGGLGNSLLTDDGIGVHVFAALEKDPVRGSAAPVTLGLVVAGDRNRESPDRGGCR
jgi:hypothetical protein